MIGNTKSVIIALCAGALVMGATGCTPSADPAETSSSPPTVAASTPSLSPTPSAKPTPKPVPASSNGPAQNWPVPKMPEAAKEQTEAGIAAFTKYWFELVSYSDATNDTKPLKSVTQRSCFLCAEQIIDPADQNKAVGAWRTGGAIDVSITLSKVIGTDGVAGFALQREKIIAYTNTGKLQGTFPETTKPMAGTLYLVFKKGWQVVDLEFIDPGEKSK